MKRGVGITLSQGLCKALDISRAVRFIARDESGFSNNEPCTGFGMEKAVDDLGPFLGAARAFRRRNHGATVRDGNADASGSKIKCNEAWHCAKVPW